LFSKAWRIGLAVVPLGAGLAVAMALSPDTRDPSQPVTLAIRTATGIVLSALTIAVVFVLVRFADRGNMSDAGLTSIRTGWRLAVWGAVLWVVPAALCFGALALLGATLSITVPVADLGRTALLLLFAVLLTEAIPEEVVFRGYVATALGALTRGWGVIVVQAVLFTIFAGALRQSWNPADLSLFLAMGIVFGYLRLVSGSVWMSIGFHTAFQTGAQLILTHHVVDFTGDVGAAMLALGVVPFAAAAIWVSSMGVPRIVDRGTQGQPS